VYFFGLRNVGDMATNFSNHGGKMANANKHMQKLVVTSKNQLNGCGYCMQINIQMFGNSFDNFELLVIISKSPSCVKY